MSFESVKARYELLSRYVRAKRPLLSSNVLERSDVDDFDIGDTLDDEMFLFMNDKVRSDLNGQLSLGCDKIDLSRLNKDVFGSVQSNFKHEYWSFYGFYDDWVIHLYTWRQTIIPKGLDSFRSGHSLFTVYFVMKNLSTGEVLDIPRHVQKWRDVGNGRYDSNKWKLVHKYVTLESELENHLFPMQIRVASDSLNIRMRLNGLWSQGVSGTVLHNVPSKSTGCLICADGVGHKLYYYPNVTGTVIRTGQSSKTITGTWFHEWQSGLNPFGTYSSLFLRALSVTSESIGRSQHLQNRVNWCQFVLHLPSRGLKVFLWFVQPVIEYNTWLRSTFCYELHMNAMGESKKNSVVYKLKFSKFSDDEERQLLECMLVREDNELQIILQTVGSSETNKALKLSKNGMYIENVSYLKVLGNESDFGVYKYFPTRKLTTTTDLEKRADLDKHATSKTDEVIGWCIILLPMLLILFILLVIVIVWIKRKRS